MICFGLTGLINIIHILLSSVSSIHSLRRNTSISPIERAVPDSATFCFCCSCRTTHPEAQYPRPKNSLNQLCCPSAPGPSVMRKSHPSHGIAAGLTQFCGLICAKNGSIRLSSIIAAGVEWCWLYDVIVLVCVCVVGED